MNKLLTNVEDETISLPKPPLQTPSLLAVTLKLYFRSPRPLLSNSITLALVIAQTCNPISRCPTNAQP